jgi:GNAT superfamily N-acetyltransferase
MSIRLNTVRIRSGCAQDVPALLQIELEAARIFPPGDLPLEFVQSASSDLLLEAVGSSSLWVAERIGEDVVVMGFLAARVFDQSLHIDEMDVSPLHGRQGVGAKLLQHAVHVAQARGLAHVTLTTFAHLPWNAPFYGRYGFDPVEDLQAFPHLAHALEQEAQRGLTRRIAMVKSVKQTQAMRRQRTHALTRNVS